MTRDYARKKRPTPKRQAPRSQIPWWVWLFIGSMLGAFIMFLVYLWNVAPNQQPPKAAATTQTPTEPKPKAEKEPDAQAELPKPRFDFYKLLQEEEVIVPATEPNRRDNDTPPATPVKYLLQVGSFRNPDDADKLRAQLILLNLGARTESVTINNNERWHRVVVGPFDNQRKLSKARSTLVTNQYNALVLQRKPGG
ncbi:SPOR domain-containing protein [Gilvimarinus polysaccharolyticus]|uniref:SPOR domain-containing protein n=1 Tax=Gilvimarinus polysaccharolyticus TaxID=863921 RepID=UPI0006739724|nr:SPOR domain-containing protein [Gilvimarinus polysaccharolyticus]